MGQTTPEQVIADIFEPELEQELTLNYHKDPYNPGEVEDKTQIGPEKWENTPRNAPCPCGSGKRYKQCHGKLEPAHDEE